MAVHLILKVTLLQNLLMSAKMVRFGTLYLLPQSSWQIIMKTTGDFVLFKEAIKWTFHLQWTCGWVKTGSSFTAVSCNLLVAQETSSSIVKHCFMVVCLGLKSISEELLCTDSGPILELTPGNITTVGPQATQKAWHLPNRWSWCLPTQIDTIDKFSTTMAAWDQSYPAKK